jgi:hypothetical protein
MKKLLIIGLSVALLSTTISCHKKSRSMPCPGLGQSNEADMSPFDEEGNLKEGGKKSKNKKKTVGRFQRDNGLINKKSPSLKGKARKRV